MPTLLLGRKPRLALSVLVVVAGLGAYVESRLVSSLAFFAIGAVLASMLHRGELPSGHLRNGRRPLQLLVLCGCIALISLRWMPFMIPGFETKAGVIMLASGVAALGLVILALPGMMLGRLLSLRPFEYLGKISFSLYLIHEPIVLAVDRLMITQAHSLRIAVAIAISLVLAHIFWYLVERPIHLLSRRIKQRIGHKESLRARAEVLVSL